MGAYLDIFLWTLEGFALSATLGWICVRWFRRHLTQDFRRHNNSEVSPVGGLCVFIAYLSISWLNGLPLRSEEILPGILLLASGLIDDRFELRARYKLLFQVGSLTLYFMLLPASDHLLLAAFGMPTMLAYAITGFWLLGILSAVNMIDGSDLEAGVVILGALFGMTLILNVGVPLYVMVGAVLGFMFFNRPPARLYLGENGSSFLGFWVGTRLCVYQTTVTPTVQLVAALALLGFAEMDALLAIVRRLRAGKPIYGGDRNHLHHRLQNFGLRNWQLALYIAGWQTAIVISVCVFVHARDSVGVILPLSALVTAAFLQIWLIQLVENRLRDNMHEICLAVFRNRESAGQAHFRLQAIHLPTLYESLIGQKNHQTRDFFDRLHLTLENFGSKIKWEIDSDILLAYTDSSVDPALVRRNMLRLFEDRGLSFQDGFEGVLASTYVWPDTRADAKTGLPDADELLLESFNGAA